MRFSDDDLFDEEFEADFEDYAACRSNLTSDELRAEKQFAASLLGVTCETEKANSDYKRYLQRRGVTSEEHEQEIGEWLDAQD